MFNEQYRVYLPILVFLVVARFVWMPLYESKEDKRNNYNSKLNRLVKAENVISSEQLLKKQLEILKGNHDVLSQSVYHSQSVSSFKLSYQKEQEAVLAKIGLEVDSFKWLEPTEDNGIYWLQAEMKLLGMLDQYVALHKQFALNGKWDNVEFVELRRKRRGSIDTTKSTGKYKIRLPVMIVERG